MVSHSFLHVVQGEIAVTWRTFMQQVGWCSSSRLLDEILTTLKGKVATKEENLQTKDPLQMKRSERIQALNSSDAIVSQLQQVDEPSSKRSRTGDANWSNIQYYSLPGGKGAWADWGRNGVSEKTIELFQSGNHPQMFQKCTVCQMFVLDAELHIQERHAIQAAPRDMYTEDARVAAGMELSDVDCQTPRRAATMQFAPTLPHVLSPLRSRLVQIGVGTALAYLPLSLDFIKPVL
jgi:hypothetical protein